MTEADRRGETLILERLAEHFPDIPVISEEDASEFGTPDAIGPRFFLVDPLDGTKAFVRGDEHFTVNIGLIEDGVPVAGAVSAPAWDRPGTPPRPAPCAAPIGTGARRADPRAALARRAAVALVSHTMKPEQEARPARRATASTTQLAMDCSVKLCMIAEGTADIYPRHGPTMEWDIAAGHAVLEAAGGTRDQARRRAVPLRQGRPGLRQRLVRGARGLGGPLPRLRHRC